MLGSPAFRAARRCHSSRRWRSDGGVAVPPASSLLLPSARVSFFHPLLLFLRVVWSRRLLAWLGSRERVPACVAAVIVPVPAVGLNPPSEPSSFVASSDVGVLLPVIPFPALNLVRFFSLSERQRMSGFVGPWRISRCSFWLWRIAALSRATWSYSVIR